MSSLLISGGAGFIGKELVKQAQPKFDRIIVYSRSESRQAEMKRDFPDGGASGMRYMIGDIRDEDRLSRAMRGVTHVIHAAALKRVEVCEYDPEEAVKTNIIGSMSIIHACNRNSVQKCLMISTDKAVEPITLYGQTKATMERMAIAANNIGTCRFSCARYANVTGSTGSVLELWDRQAINGGPLTITDKRMTRMWIDKTQAAEFVLRKLEKMDGGEIFVPLCPAYKLISMAESISSRYLSGGSCIEDGAEPGIGIEEIGLRPNEKLHEVLISESDARDCWLQGDGSYTIYPATHDWRAKWVREGLRMPDDFRLSSDRRFSAGEE